VVSEERSSASSVLNEQSENLPHLLRLLEIPVWELFKLLDGDFHRHVSGYLFFGEHVVGSRRNDSVLSKLCADARQDAAPPTELQRRYRYAG